MTKRITDSQMLGELGETAVKKLVLEMKFIYEHRGRLEAGTDGFKAAREVGRILKHIDFGTDVSSDFRKYS